MLTGALLSLLILTAPAPGCFVQGLPSADSLHALYQQGRTWAAFLAAAKENRSDWRSNYGRARPDTALVATMRARTGTLRLLVVAEDWCPDALNTVPFIAALVDSSAGRLEMRVIGGEAGRSILMTHQTFDKRGATPTVLLLDAGWNEVGCWVERPHVLGAWARENKTRLAEEVYASRKAAWYAKDAGGETLREIGEMIAKAGPGRPCGGNAY